VTGSGVASTILPIVIVPVLLLAAWLATVIYMASHPARRGRDEEPAPHDAGLASRGAATAPGPERAGPAVSGGRGAVSGGGAGGRAA